MKEKDIVTLAISSVNSEGEGIARCEENGVKNFVVFVPGVLPGERVKCRIVRMSKNYAAAEALDILEASPDRVSPSCPSYGLCGGCQLQHAAYGAQIEMKKKILTDAMNRIGKFDIDFEVDNIPSPDEWGYRSKTVLPVGKYSGYYERRSHRIVKFDRCPVLRPSLEKVMSDIISSHAASGLRGYDEKAGRGDIRALAARAGNIGGGDEIIAGVVAARELSHREFGTLRNLHQKLGAENPDLIGSVLNVKTSADNFIWGPVFKPLCGGKFLTAGLGGYRFSMDISAFFQINVPQAERIFSRVRDEVKSSGSSSLLELYSGVGGVTAYLAGVAGRIDAVEEWRPSARLLGENMERNLASNVRVFTESAENFMGNQDNTARGKYDTIVLDPPRTGVLDAVVSGIRQILPRKIIYVSCNPATLARDAARICEDGAYGLESLAAYDMFPQTSHVESLCVLKKA